MCLFIQTTSFVDASMSYSQSKVSALQICFDTSCGPTQVAFSFAAYIYLELSFSIESEGKETGRVGNRTHHSAEKLACFSLVNCSATVLWLQFHSIVIGMSNTFILFYIILYYDECAIFTKPLLKKKESTPEQG